MSEAAVVVGSGEDVSAHQPFSRTCALPGPMFGNSQRSRRISSTNAGGQLRAPALRRPTPVRQPGRAALPIRRAPRGIHPPPRGQPAGPRTPVAQHLGDAGLAVGVSVDAQRALAIAHRRHQFGLRHINAEIHRRRSVARGGRAADGGRRRGIAWHRRGGGGDSGGIGADSGANLRLGIAGAGRGCCGLRFHHRCLVSCCV